MQTPALATGSEKIRAPSRTFLWDLGSILRPLEVAGAQVSRCVLIFLLSEEPGTKPLGGAGPQIVPGIDSAK